MLRRCSRRVDCLELLRCLPPFVASSEEDAVELVAAVEELGPGVGLRCAILRNSPGCCSSWGGSGGGAVGFPSSEEGRKDWVEDDLG